MIRREREIFYFARGLKNWFFTFLKFLEKTQKKIFKFIKIKSGNFIKGKEFEWLLENFIKSYTLENIMIFNFKYEIGNLILYQRL